MKEILFKAFSFSQIVYLTYVRTYKYSKLQLLRFISADIKRCLSLSHELIGNSVCIAGFFLCKDLLLNINLWNSDKLNKLVTSWKELPSKGDITLSISLKKSIW